MTGQPRRIALTLHETEAILGHLPRCTRARSSSGSRKRLFPLLKLAEFVGVAVGGTPYLCPSTGEPHWHLATRPLNSRGSAAKPARLPYVWYQAAEVTTARGVRTFVYGTRRTSDGQWMYRWCYASDRHTIKREGEL